MRKGPDAQSSSATNQDPLPMSVESIFSPAEDLSVFPHFDEVVVNLVDMYFRLRQDSFFNFLH